MIYPNPNHGSFSIDYYSEINDALSIDIYDLCGKLVHSQKWSVTTGYNNKKLDISEIGKGVYFTKISTVKGMSVYKMIVESNRHYNIIDDDGNDVLISKKYLTKTI